MQANYRLSSNNIAQPIKFCNSPHDLQKSKYCIVNKKATCIQNNSRKEHLAQAQITTQASAINNERNKTSEFSSLDFELK